MVVHQTHLSHSTAVVVLTIFIVVVVTSLLPHLSVGIITSANGPTLRRTSALIPLSGNVYPDGVYYAELIIGGKPYFLDLDTASDLTWLHCNAPCVRCHKGPHPWYKPSKTNLIPCSDPVCAAVQASAPLEGHRGCDNPTEQCDYEIEYADGASSLGVLVADQFSLPFNDGTLLLPKLTFGCGYDQGSVKESLTDGVLGLGPGKSSMLSQLSGRGILPGIMGHCLGRRGGGFLFIGDEYIPESGIVWTAMSGLSWNRKYYTAGPASLVFGESMLIGNGLEVAFDSGSTYTYFAEKHYETFVAALVKGLDLKQVKAAKDDRVFPMCWNGFGAKVDYKGYFSSLFLRFGAGEGAVLEIPPEGYLIHSKSGNLCLGILNGSENGLKDLNVIGDVSMQDYLVIYDNERDRIGWMHTNCDGEIKMDDSTSQSYVYGDAFCQPRATS